MSDEAKTRPLVGVAVMIFWQGLLLIGRREGSHGAGSYSVPGGHLEHGETPVQAARREILEEVGLTLEDDDVQVICATSNVVEDKHYVTLFYAVNLPDSFDPRSVPGPVPDPKFVDVHFAEHREVLVLEREERLFPILGSALSNLRNKISEDFVSLLLRHKTGEFFLPHVRDALNKMATKISAERNSAFVVRLRTEGS
jgi:ADP-ribose pyrophosphatase YjhB (NUDIX family)